MSSQRNRSLIQEFEGLVSSIEEDMKLICSTASSSKKVLEDTPELIDDAFKTCCMDSLSELNKLRAELKSELSLIRNVAIEPETGEMAKRFKDGLRQQPELTESQRRTEFPELRELRRTLEPERSEFIADVEMVEGGQQVHVDPLTRLPIKKLVQNKRCKHYYCYETIIGHIKTGPYPRCPIAGCSLAHIRESDLEFVN